MRYIPNVVQMNSFSSKWLFSAFSSPMTEADNLQSFIDQRFQDTNCRYVTVSFSLDNIDPLACLEMAWKKNQFHYYWEHPAEDFAIAAGEELIELTAEGKSRFQEIHQQINAVREATEEYSQISHSYAGLLFLGGFSFFDELSGDIWNSFSAASFTVPRWAIIKDGQCTLLTLSLDLDSFGFSEAAYNHLCQKLEQVKNLISLHGSRSSARNHSSPVSTGDVSVPHNEYDRWISAVNRAKQKISQNTFKKIVLARQVSVPCNDSTSPTQLINILRQQYRSCYNFLIHRPDNTTFLGSTPERLGSFRKRLLLTEALAGSIERGKTATDDSYLENKLSQSPKNRREHTFVVNDIEQRLEPMVEKVTSAGQPAVKKLFNVQHLYTSIRARLKEHTSPLSILERLHPTPAVGGYPRKEAFPYIRQLENFNRGWYAGPIGWLNAKGLGDFAVGIRSGLLTKNTAYFFAGCGIVADSDAAAEWEETNLKLKPMLSVLQYD